MTKVINCPVTGHLLGDLESSPSSVYQNMSWYFCSENCKTIFMADPNRYVHQYHISEKSNPFTANNMEKVQITIEDMSCASSAVAIEKEIEKLPGIKKGVVNGVLEKAYVEFDRTEISLSRIVGAIKKSGYKAGQCYRVN